MHGKSRSQVDALSSKSKKDQAEETKKSPILYIQYQDWLLPVPLQTWEKEQTTFALLLAPCAEHKSNPSQREMVTWLCGGVPHINRHSIYKVIKDSHGLDINGIHFLSLYPKIGVIRSWHMFAPSPNLV